MKKLIGFFGFSLVVGCVLFNGIANGADENAVSAVDIWFPANIGVWTYMLPEGNQANVWVEKKLKGNVFLSDTYFIKETRSVFADSPFSWYCIENGNILGYGGNEYIKSLWVSMVKRELGLSIEEAQDMKKTFKFSSEEWLLLPAQLSDGLEWEVIKYEFTNPFGAKQGSTIKGSCRYWYWDWTFDPIYPQAKEWTKSAFYIDLSFSGFVSDEDKSGLYFDCLEKIGVIGLGMIEDGGIDPKEAIVLAEFRESQDVSSVGKMTTTWGKIKTQ